MNENIQGGPSKTQQPPMQSTTQLKLSPSSKTPQAPLPSATQVAEQEVLQLTAHSRTRQTPAQSTIQVAGQETDQESAQASTEKKKRRKWRRVKRKMLFDKLDPREIIRIEGVRKITLPPLVQKIVKCLVGEHVTSEIPWKHIRKEDLEDNLELHEESSEFLPIKEEILAFPGSEILIIYLPEEMSEQDDFYLCLTEAAEATVSEIIGRVVKQREERLNNSIVKAVGEWQTLGSEAEVEDMQVINTRPLLEVEVETPYPIFSTKRQFTLRLVQNAKDGYVEILSRRQTFLNLQRKLIDASVQVSPPLISNEAQTVYTYPKNVFTQYEFKYPPTPELSEEFKECMKSFVIDEMDKISDVMYVNSNINFFTNDYADLAKDSNFAGIFQSPKIKPYTSFAEPSLCKGKEIACVSWHPMWSGTVAIAYSDTKVSDYRKYNPSEDEVERTMYDISPVLLWSFKDDLYPRLLLETPREVTTLSWCPYNENILVGGTVNGQIVIWDITNKLKGVEEAEILTAKQIRYRMLLNKFMTWMKNTKDLKVVRLTVASELEYSHFSGVTAIRWISPYREITSSGQIKEIPLEENRTSAQFMTASKDGTVLSWDLNAKPLLYTSSYRPQRKLRRLKKRPSALTINVSPLRALHRLFKPLFKVNVIAPNTSRNLPLSELSLKITKADYEEVNPDPNRKFNISDRILFRPIYKIPTHPLVNKFAAGSVEGDFFVASWEGFSCNSGEVVNKENCTFESFGKYHDGPVIAISRSEVFPDLILTVGGKVFALWWTAFVNRPVIWRRSKVRYTHGVWNRFQPSAFRLSREDGAIELWHLKSRSDRYTSINFISGSSLGSTTTHPFRMQQNVIGTIDSKGFFRLFFIARAFNSASEDDKKSTYRICKRDMDKKQKFLKWQEEWTLKHVDEIKAKKEHELIKRQDKEEELRQERKQLEAEEEELRKEIESLGTMSKPEPGRYSEWARQQLQHREKERMMAEVLRKKNLNLQVLEKQRQPLLKLAEEEKIKKKNQEKRISMAKKIFDETVAMLFPEAVEKKPPSTPDPYAGGDSKDAKILYFENYLEIEEECKTYIDKKHFLYEFNWLRVLRAGKDRRKIIDGYYTRYNHKNRIMREKMNTQNEAVTELTKTGQSKTSLGFIEYATYSEDNLEPAQNLLEEEGEG